MKTVFESFNDLNNVVSDAEQDHADMGHSLADIRKRLDEMAAQFGFIPVATPPAPGSSLIPADTEE